MVEIPKGRLKWLDTAKGISILLVVFWHVLLLSKYAHFTPENFYFSINDPLLSIRMPLFFAVSGYVAAHSIGETWSKYFLKRLFPLIWLYALWTAIYTLVQSKSPSYLLTAWWSPELHLWFIWALLAYRIFGKVAGPARALALCFFAVLALLFSFDATTPEWITPIQARMPRNAAFFLATFWFGRSFIPHLGHYKYPVFAAGAILAAISYRLDFVPGVSVAGATAGLAFAAIIAATVKPVEAFFEFLGRHSLEIFVIHFAAVAHFLAIIARLPIPHVAAVPLTTLVGALVPVGIRMVSDRFAPWLFVPPTDRILALLGNRAARQRTQGRRDAVRGDTPLTEAGK